jgi:DNA-binding transcriptional LysR family regulator
MSAASLPPHGTELRHLRAFVAVAEHGSVSAAARELLVSQQSVSRTVDQLERRLGVRLFARHARGVEPTRAGRAMLPAALRALAAAGEAADAARTASAAGELSVRVDISSGGIETGALIVRRLRSERPDVAVHEVEVGVARAVELIRADGLDLVLGRAAPVPEELRSEPIRREQMLVGMAAGHPLAAHAAVPVDALAGVDLLLPSDEAAGEWNAFVADRLSRSGVPLRRFPGTTHGSVAAAEVVRDGSCVVPTMAWTDPPAGLVFRPLADPGALFTWAMAWRAGAERQLGVAAFLGAARVVAHERGWLAE